MQYDPSFVRHRFALSDEDRQWLHRLTRIYPLARFKSDHRNYEETVVDFVYTSAKIEGNTYDRIDTDNLLRFGVTAGGKRYSDAVMLVNLRNGFEQVMAVEPDDVLDLDYVCDLHKTLMRDLLPVNEQGIGRSSDVNITGAAYTPLSDASGLRTEIRFVLKEADKYTDPFEQAIYLHCNLAYLQYFRDGNKRTARLVQTASLARAQVLPLLFKDTLIGKYQKATLHYYETGNYAPYVDFFKENYELAVFSLAGRPDASDYQSNPSEATEFDRRLQLLAGLAESSGVGKVFWGLAQEEISARGSPRSVNWADIERRTIVKAIAEHGLPKSDVRRVLLECSPGTASPVRCEQVAEDIERLDPVLRAQT
ncbi:MAG: Fic family protein [Burkholderiaceae bacterium]|nr:Fic family protein [Burkholderiaceae bacterium]MCD8515951.1 Fic family protein [Burkholderiaceae bacterium]MCD8536999.1 Fic family protein [Burkholderiaceae bacterium]